MEFNNEKELLLYLIQKQKECEFSLRTFLQRDDDSWRNCFSLLKLIKKGSRKKVKFDYGKYVFEDQIINISKGIDIISNLYSVKDDIKSTFIIPNYDSFESKIIGDLDFASSKYEYASMKANEYPVRFFKFHIPQHGSDFKWHYELLKKELPYYPDIKEAILHLFDVRTPNFSSYGQGIVIIPDYRARIDRLKMIFSKAELTIDSPEIPFEDLLIKAYATSGTQRKTIPDIKIKEKVIEIDVSFQPDVLSTVLYSQTENLKIDEKEFTTWRSEKEGIFIERPEEEIVSLTKIGENQQLEYKLDIQTDNAKNKLQENIVSFSNTNKGTILIGVNDKGNILGTSKNVDDVQKMIHDSCDPPPTNIKIEEKIIDEKKLLIVEVPEGDSKPYQSKRDKQFYIRHNANDMRMERSELLAILDEKTQGNYQV